MQPYNPLMELKAYDYPPASEVGRGRYKHLFGSGGLFNAAPGASEQQQQPPPSQYGGTAMARAGFAPQPFIAPQQQQQVPYAGAQLSQQQLQLQAMQQQQAAAQQQQQQFAPPGQRLRSTFQLPQTYAPMNAVRGNRFNKPASLMARMGGPHGMGPAAHSSVYKTRYKTKYCSFFMDSNGAFCPHGPSCQFAHGPGELRGSGDPSMGVMQQMPQQQRMVQPATTGQQLLQPQAAAMQQQQQLAAQQQQQQFMRPHGGPQYGQLLLHQAAQMQQQPQAQHIAAAQAAAAQVAAHKQQLYHTERMLYHAEQAALESSASGSPAADSASSSAMQQQSGADATPMPLRNMGLAAHQLESEFAFSGSNSAQAQQRAQVSVGVPGGYGLLQQQEQEHFGSQLPPLPLSHTGHQGQQQQLGAPISGGSGAPGSGVIEVEFKNTWSAPAPAGLNGGSAAAAAYAPQVQQLGTSGGGPSSFLPPGAQLSGQTQQLAYNAHTKQGQTQQAGSGYSSINAPAPPAAPFGSSSNGHHISSYVSSLGSRSLGGETSTSGGGLSLGGASTHPSHHLGNGGGASTISGSSIAPGFFYPLLPSGSAARGGVHSLHGPATTATITSGRGPEEEEEQTQEELAAAAQRRKLELESHEDDDGGGGSGGLNSDDIYGAEGARSSSSSSGRSFGTDSCTAAAPLTTLGGAPHSPSSNAGIGCAVNNSGGGSVGRKSPSSSSNSVGASSINALPAFPEWSAQFGALSLQ